MIHTRMAETLPLPGMDELPGTEAQQVGDLPFDWEIVPLGTVVEVHDRRRVPLSSEQRRKIGGQYPYCGANGIIDHINEYIFDGQFVLLAEDGGYWGPYQQSSYVMEGRFWVNNHAHILRALVGKSDSSYLMYVLNYLDLDSYISGTTRGKLNQGVMSRIPIPLPPLPEQRAIAHVLGTVQRAIEASERVLGATREFKRSLMRHLFTYGPVPLDQAERVALKEAEVGRIPERWEPVRLGDIATLQRGNDLPVMERRQGPYPVIGSSGVVGYHSDFVSHGPGVLVGRSGSVGSVSWVDEDYWPLNTALWVRDFHGNDARFVYYFLSHMELSQYSTGVSVPTLNRNLVHPLQIGKPPLSEQREISSALSAADCSISREQKRKQILEALFQSLLHHLMTGKVRVKTA